MPKEAVCVRRGLPCPCYRSNGGHLTANGPTPVIRLLQALRLVREAECLEPAAGSPADLEMKAFARPLSVETAYSYGLLALESAGDHLAAYDAMVHMEAFSVAPLTCVRGMLEAAAVSSWQLDPSVCVADRVARNLALRFSTLTMQRMVATGQGDATGAEHVQAKIERLEELALGLGYPLIRNKDETRGGVGCRRPTISAMLESEFGFEGAYRPLSAVAHADAIALLQVGFSSVERIGAIAYVQKEVPIQLQHDLLASATLLYMQPAWHHVVQFGRDRTQATQLFEAASDELGLKGSDDVRFWRGGARNQQAGQPDSPTDGVSP